MDDRFALTSTGFQANPSGNLFILLPAPTDTQIGIAGRPAGGALVHLIVPDQK